MLIPEIEKETAAELLFLPDVMSYRGRVPAYTVSQSQVFRRYTDLQSDKWPAASPSPPRSWRSTVEQHKQWDMSGFSWLEGQNVLPHGEICREQSPSLSRDLTSL